MAQAVHNALLDWEVNSLVQAMCFDTTSSNTGTSMGACTVLEHLLDRSLLHLAWRHHILELVLGVAFAKCMGSACGRDILILKRFQTEWSSIDKGRSDNVFSDDLAMTELAQVRNDLLACCEAQLQDHQPRDDYAELLELTLLFLGKRPPDGTKFRPTGPMQQARWTAKHELCLAEWSRLLD